MKTILRTQDFSCPSCVAKVEKALKQLDGVQAARVHFATGRVEVEHDPDKVQPEALAQAVTDAGYTARVAPY